MFISRPKWTTLRLLCAVAVATLGGYASGATIPVVSPSTNQNTEGNGVATPTSVPLRIQHLIPASDFAGLPETHRLLVSFNFRADQSQTQSIDWGSGDERIWMSTTDKDSLTTVFDDNHGQDRAMVYDGPIAYPLLGTGPVGGPRDIADGPQLQTPFYYDPSQGNLLIERLISVNNPSARANIDTQLTQTARILINDANPASATGSRLTEVAVLQFEFAAVPEPSTFVLASLGLLAVVTGRRKRRPVAVT